MLEARSLYVTHLRQSIKHKEVSSGMGATREIAVNVFMSSIEGFGNMEPSIAFLTKNNQIGKRDLKKQPKGNRFGIRYQRIGHTANQCFKIIGYLD